MLLLGVVGMKMLIWWCFCARARKKKKIPETSRDYLKGGILRLPQNLTALRCLRSISIESFNNEQWEAADRKKKKGRGKMSASSN